MIRLAGASAPPAISDEIDVPRYSRGFVISMDQVESETLRQVAAYWSALRGARKFPTRNDLSPAGMKGLLRHVTLVRVLDGGVDYEFRIVGDVQVQAYGENFRGKTLSEVGRKYSKFAEGLKIFYDGARMGGEPFGYRGWIGRDMPDTRYSYHECAFFPLGESDLAVDHILVAGIYMARGSGKLD
ncbi:MAG TPA: PAS domain-containing protein [Rhizomicrobium sp.]|jgi:hypothetical protein|nr:PAS domain-containing protein [Rhizomicrobium sp.]